MDDKYTYQYFYGSSPNVFKVQTTYDKWLKISLIFN